MIFVLDLFLNRNSSIVLIFCYIQKFIILLLCFLIFWFYHFHRAWILKKWTRWIVICTWTNKCWLSILFTIKLIIWNKSIWFWKIRTNQFRIRRYVLMCQNWIFFGLCVTSGEYLIFEFELNANISVFWRSFIWRTKVKWWLSHFILFNIFQL